MKIAIYPGSFDPVTLGHLNIIKRASKAFDKVIVCVMVNSRKTGMFSPEERLDFLRRSIQMDNVEVDTYSGLVSDYAKIKNAQVLVKGLRAVSDFEAEVQMAMVNSQLNKELDTVFLPCSPKYSYLSSTVVKELARYNANLEDVLPREIIEDIKLRMEERRGVCDDKS